VQWALESSSTYTTETTSVKSFSKTGLTTDVKYKFKVRSMNQAGWSTYSEETVIKTAKAPDAPVNLMIDQTISTSKVLRLTWQKGVDDGAAAVKNYIVYFDDGSTNDW